MMAALMEQFLGSTGGDGSDQDLQSMLQGFMDELMSKAIMYQPMKELNDQVRLLVRGVVLLNADLVDGSTPAGSNPIDPRFPLPNSTGTPVNPRSSPRSSPSSKTRNGTSTRTSPRPSPTRRPKSGWPSGRQR